MSKQLDGVIEGAIDYFVDVSVNGSGMLYPDDTEEIALCSYSEGVVGIRVYKEGCLMNIISIDVDSKNIAHDYDTDELCVSKLQELHCPF